MPTASNMPMPMNALDAFSKGFGLTDNLMKNLLAKQQLAQQMQIHKDALGIQRQQQARLAQMMPLQIQALQDAHAKAEMETDPAKKMAYIQQIMQGVREMQGGAQVQQQEPQPAFPPFQGIGMPSMQQPQQLVSPPSREQVQQGFTPEQQIALSMAGIQVPTIKETPEQKEAREIRTAGEKEQEKANIKTRMALEEELPKSDALMKRIEAAIPMIDANPDLFGPGVGGFDWLGGPNQRYRGLKDPKKIAAFKHLQNLFAHLQGQQAADFSSRSMKVVFDLAAQAKASMADHPEAAKQTLQDMLEKMRELRQEDIKRLEKAGGEAPQAKRLKYNPVTGRLE